MSVSTGASVHFLGRRNLRSFDLSKRAPARPGLFFCSTAKLAPSSLVVPAPSACEREKRIAARVMQNAALRAAMPPSRAGLLLRNRMALRSPRAASSTMRLATRSLIAGVRLASSFDITES